MQSLGALPGDIRSIANDINELNQVVGTSRGGPFGTRAFLWRDGAMTDLNTVTLGGSPFLLTGNNINARGEVGGEAFDPNTGDAPAYVAFPTSDSGISAGAGTNAAPAQAIPESVRRRVRDHFDADDNP